MTKPICNDGGLPLELAEQFQACTAAWTGDHKFELLRLDGKLMATVFWASPGPTGPMFIGLLNGQRIESRQPKAFVNKLHKAVTASLRPKPKESKHA